VVKSLVEDVITPPFGFLLGGVDFDNLTIKMSNFIYKDQPPVVIRYGKFIQEIIYLIIMALVLFFIIKSINKIQEIAIKRRLEEGSKAKKELSDEVKVLVEIRDILAQKTPVLEELIL
jgi:large conductance mechanosensitive channel